MSTTGPRIGNLDFRDLAEGEVLGKFGGVAAGIAAQPTNQGKDFLVVDAQPLANTTSATLVNIPGASGVVNVPHDGTFVVALSLSFYITAAGSGAYFGLLVDGVTQYAPATWVRAANEANSHKDGGPFYVAIPLTKGQRTLQVQWRRSGTGTLTMDAGDRLQLLLSVPGGTATVFHRTLRDTQHTATAISTFSGNPSAWQDIQAGITDDNGDGLLNLPATGSYKFSFEQGVAHASGDFTRAQWRLLIDGVTEVTAPSWSEHYDAGSNNHKVVQGEAAVVLTAGVHTWKLQWRRADGAGQICVHNSASYTVRVTVEGGAAVNASLDARGEDESIVYVDNVAEGTANPANGPVFLGYTVEAGSLRGLSIGLDGGTVTAGTVNADLLINGSQVATVVLNTTDNTFAINNTDVPFVAKGSKVEVRIRTSGYTNSASTNLLVGVRGKISVSAAIIRDAFYATGGTYTSSGATSWTGIATGTGLSFTNKIDDGGGVSRSGDVLTFIKGGRYRLRAVWVVGTTVQSYFGLRARKTNGTPATLLKFFQFLDPSTGQYAEAEIEGPVDVLAGDTVQLQYVRQAGAGAFGLASLDGETTQFASIYIERIA